MNIYHRSVPYGTRTHDPRIKSPMLSSLAEPTELREHEVQIELDYILSRKKGDLNERRRFWFYSQTARRSPTCYFIQACYQLKEDSQSPSVFMLKLLL